ncbi:hypothetical protein [Streptomyces sp. NPDC059994]|uniref:hypothetical protein n=1 Tax=Streptomyces sp. NPDC059994 TaxID=3347029 RepID=UPI0036C8A837
MFIAAEDDLGNEYTDWGGVFGLAPDGSRTQGEVSGQPGLPAAARTLHLRITFLRGGQEQPYELTLSLS